MAARFHCGDVKEGRRLVAGTFDIVFLSWGILHWIEDLEQLALDIEHWLAPGGFLYLLDRHPLLDMRWRATEGNLNPKRGYFNRGALRAFDFGPDYAEEDYRPTQQRAYKREWELGQVVSAFAKAGLTIAFLHEHEILRWRGLWGLEQGEDGFWRMPQGYPSLPLSFSIKATKSER